MQMFWIEGVYVPKQKLKKVKATGSAGINDVEPFARAIWANTPDEALALAGEALEGGEWVEAPKVSRKTEEQRMRGLGAPELPGFCRPMGKKKTS